MNSFLRIAGRYVMAGGLAYIAAHPAALIALGYYGFPDSGGELLSATKFMSFAAVAAGAFCFPAGSRPFRAVALLGFGLLYYCARDYARANDLFFPPRFPYPLFASLLQGGIFAVGFHVLLAGWRRMRRVPEAALKPTTA